MAATPTSATPTSKYMTEGEVGLGVALMVGALLCALASARAVDAPFSIHMAVFALAALAGLVTILRRYGARPAAPPRQEIDGKPNYNLGPIKFATVAAMAWGIAGFSVGCIIAFQLWAPSLNLGLEYTSFGRLRPLHTSAVIFALRRQRPDRHVLLRRAAHLPRPAARVSSRPGSCCSATTCSSSSPAPAT